MHIMEISSESVCSFLHLDIKLNEATLADEILQIME